MAGLAGALGESESSVSRGMQSSIAAVLGGLASKAGDPGALRTMLNLAPDTSGAVPWSQLAAGVSDPNSALMSGAKSILSGLFGTSQGTVTSAISTASGLRPGVTSSLMAMAAPMVMSFLVKRVRDQGMSMSSLGSLLQQESPEIRSALPAGLSDLFWPRTATTGAVPPVVAEPVHVEKARSSLGWLPLLALALLLPGLLWFFSHPQRPTTAQITPTTGTANRVATDLGDLGKRTMPTSVDLRFATGSARLLPESQEQLNNFAADLRAYPDVRVNVGGYTDNVGSAERNRQLSQERANSVMAELVNKGISADRLTAEGFGEQNFIADNSTATGRAQNRRVTVSVTVK
jgi:outer membrane protein OmpA-like peptidoglycan-associated protein